ncbi:MAG: 30S ribosomal protein S17 [Anaerolineae bacterium]|nr:30S ribosomal protein S17 [Anaerolineae bacterium]
MTNKRRRLTGRVISAKMHKTIMVAVSTTKQHPVYGKVLKTTKKYMVHDEAEAAQPGDIVRIVESRPVSKRKRWALEAIEKRAHGLPVAVAEADAGIADAMAAEGTGDDES